MKTVIVNPERCMGCHQCELACLVEHSQSQNLVQALSESPRPHGFIMATPGISMNSAFPSKCRHCDPAPCMAVCPTSAIGRDADMGMVLINGNKCISCGMCAMVCPFDVITFHPSFAARKGSPVAVKCDHCINRQKDGREPACVEICKSGALEFGDINDLVKKARTRVGRSVSTASAQVMPEEEALPANVVAWRQLGHNIELINQRKQKGGN
ncbi:4Fe-4S dicluster domain-containing protein [Chloroflexota bacterium]